jgi:hypothetical protein
MFTCCAAAGLEIRGYNSEDINGAQKWLLNIPGQWLWHHPPYINPDFTTFDATKLLAIGWPEDHNDWTRQLALISPRHIIYATHYTLNPSWLINFLGSDGQQHTAGIESQVPIVNNLGQNTDLMLVTLSTPVNVAGVTPFKVLNLANEAAYIHKPLLVCGSFVLASTTELQGFTTLTGDPGFDTTRFLYFDYDRNATSDTLHRCNVRPGDSGGPVFVMENGEPAIVGTISGYDDLTPNDNVDGPKFRSYMSSIPSYMPQVDALMEAKGYHLKRFYPGATTLGTTVSANGPLRQMKPGSITITTANSGAVAADNINLTLTFPTAPTAVSGSGWICEAATPLVWNCRRGGISAAANSTLTASWDSLPNSQNLQISVAKTYDGGTPGTISPALPLLQSYTSWIQGVADPAQNADSDGDGIPNLLEYAFGGSPTQSSPLTTYGRYQMPQMERAGDNLLVHFPFRTDAAARGLTDTVEFSTDVTPGSWESSQPAGTTIQNAPFSPAVPGFEQITVSLPMNVAKRFVRVKVSLAE